MRSRLSLYGTEDRIVLALGSKFWYWGFSSEPQPRGLINFRKNLWNLSPLTSHEIREELKANIQSQLRKIFYQELMIDSKNRKIILTENFFLPIFIKEMVTEILFNNLNVLNVSWCDNALLSLLSSGNVTGLVIDIGNLETVISPVSSLPFLVQYKHRN